MANLPTFRVAAPCPNCGHTRVIGYTLVDEHGSVRDTVYACRFFKRGAVTPCGWTSTTMPHDLEPT